MATTSPQTLSKLNALLTQYRAAKDTGKTELQTTAVTAQPTPEQETISTVPVYDPNIVTDRYGNQITLNSKQAEFVEIAGRQGKSAVLIGPAGTGKSTTQFAVCQAKIQSGQAGILLADGHKNLTSGSPGIIICAFTRRAVANIKRNLPKDLQSNAITIHKLLEYEPTYTDVTDPVTGETKSKMSFEPARCADFPLPRSITTIIIEEASMLSVELYRKLVDAIQHHVQFIFLGDIQQLPPIFGPAILGFKILELPHVELTEVYRQALESPIISLAHRVLSGRPVEHKELVGLARPGLTIKPWKKSIKAEDALITMAAFFKQAETHGVYDSEEDIILIPFNKSFGTDELNKYIANHLARKRGALTYEIIASYNKHYLSVGDKVMYDKEDGVVEEITTNPSYSGVQPQIEGTTLDYWGHHQDPNNVQEHEYGEDAIDLMLAASVAGRDEDTVRQASHEIKIRMSNTDRVVTLTKAGEVNLLSLGYCMTVHKSQGSEWRKVFFCLHQSHNTMISRELLYTGVTRAKEELYVICEPDTFVKGINSQRVKGNTLEEKAEFFKGKIEAGYVVDF
jgi:exodeoxyribonuclease V alpha subunit